MKSILVAAMVALFVSLIGTKAAVSFLTRRRIGQQIRDDGPTSHQSKKGTPTMGGVVILAATVAGYLASHLVTIFDPHAHPTASGLLVLGLMLGLGAVGFADDAIKWKKQRSLGLTAKAKFAGQAVVALAFGAGALMLDGNGQAPGSRAVSFVRDIPMLAFGAGTVGAILFLLWVYLIISATSNGVNLTDGLDGLAAGVAAMVFGSYVVIAFWQFGNRCGDAAVAAGCYQVRDPLDVAVVAAAVLGACFGFLWWNASPAKIFMGDTGSLALGGGLAGIAVVTKTELLLVVLGGLFVLETLSVIAQVASFKLTGKRVLRMAPLHHHFELSGWAENTVIVRLWIIGGICAAVGLGIFYAEFLTHGMTG